MEAFLLLIFAVLGAFTSCLELFKRKIGKGDPTDRSFLRFRHNYVLVYAFMMGAWASTA